MGVTHRLLRYAPAFDKDVLSPLPSSTTSATGVQVGTNFHAPDLDYADDVVLLSNSYMEMQSLHEAVSRHAAAAGMCINASKTKVMSALISGGRSVNFKKETQCALTDCRGGCCVLTTEVDTGTKCRRRPGRIARSVFIHRFNS